MKRLTTEEFISKAVQVHEMKYDYTNVNYIKSSVPVSIECNTCKCVFEQTPNNHLAGKGCPSCANNIKISTKDFIEKAQQIHKNNYDYNLVNYKSTHKKVSIKCNTCKCVFEQTPANHLQGNRCTHCYSGWNHLQKYQNNKELGSEPGIFYKLKFKHKKLGFEFLKIGITGSSIKKRYRSYKDYTYEIIEEHKVTNLESAIMEKRFINETNLTRFEFPNEIYFKGHTECYNINTT